MANTQNKNKKKGSVRGLLLKVAVGAAAVYLAVTFIGGQMQVAAKQQALAEAAAQVDAQIEENTELQRIIDTGDQNAYIERLARDKLGYGWPDERLIVDIGSE